MAPSAVLVIAPRNGQPRRVQALRGTRLTLGRAPEADVRIVDDSVALLHAVLERRGDHWWIVAQRVGPPSRGSELLIDGRALGSAELGDGAVIFAGNVQMQYFANGAPAIVDVEHRGRWVCFSPWRATPAMSYALSLDGDDVRIATCLGVGAAFPAGRAVLDATPSHQFVDDIAGVSLEDIIARTRAHHGAVLDPRVALCAAAEAVKHVDAGGADTRLARGTLVTFRGDVVWLHRAASVRGPWWRHLVEDVLTAVGCPGPSSWIAGGRADQLLEAQLPQIAALDLEPALAAGLRDLARGCLDVDAPAPHVVVQGIERIRAQFPDDTAAFLRTTIAELFPDELALDEQVRDEAGTLGVAGVLARR